MFMLLSGPLEAAAALETDESGVVPGDAAQTEDSGGGGTANPPGIGRSS